MVQRSSLPLKLYIYRHGETAFNAQNIVQGGSIDAPLNETGQQQAQRFYEKYQSVSFEAVYTSTMIRTLQTAQPFIDSGIPHFALADLKELSWGIVEGKPHTGETERQMVETNERWIAGELDYKIEGGESANDVLRRVQRTEELILSRHPSGNILICTHGRLIRLMLAHLLGYGVNRMTLFKHQNTSLNILVKAGKHYFAEKMNDVSHLEMI